MTDTMIHLLDESLIQKIAAGEVIERPASVVKELVENAIDAGAKSISVDIKGSGCDEITVIDDGSGMGPDDMRLSIQRHATSKISSEDDLSRIATLGFRGEALAAIAQVSRLTLESRSRGTDAGHRLSIEGGKVLGLTPHGVPFGTRIVVRDLFFNTPARKKFLRSAVTERMQIEKVMSSQALSHPEVRWLLKNEGEILFSSEGSGNIAEVMRAVFGAEVASRCQMVTARRGPLGLTAWLGDPVQARRSAQNVFLLVNKRVVSDRGLVRAIIDGYSHQILTAHFPTAVLSLEIPADQVDVNVHPTKAEVRFAYPAGVYDFVRGEIQKIWSVNVRQEQGLPPFDPPTVRPEPVEGNGWRAQDRPVEARPTSPTLSEHAGVLQLFPNYSTLRPLGQLAKTYIVCEGPNGLVLVDQHAAHERVGFESLKQEYETGAVQRQILLVPITFELKPSQGEVLRHLMEDLEPFGLVVEPFGKTTYVIKEIPVLLDGADFPALILELIEEAESGSHLAPLTTRAEEVLERMACHRQLRAGDSLLGQEIESLLVTAERAGAYQCPHGRPALIEMSLDEIERRFHRKL